MNMPVRFDLTYIDSNGEKKRPVMLHRTIFGSVERFIGILIEHFAGAFPLWLAPVQVKILPVNPDYHLEFCEALKARMIEEGIRVELDERNEKLGYRLREAQINKIPVQLVIGDGEIANGEVNVRRYGKNESVTMKVEDFFADLHREIKAKSL
jgi:threonyl-tRNA synthetase